MNTQAITNLLTSARNNIARIDADLANMRATKRYDMYHQGYQNGRKAELESLITTLEIALAVTR